MMIKNLLPVCIFACLATGSASASDIKAGDYLASRFAQVHHDWSSASDFLEGLVAQDFANNDSEMMVRAMILSMGSGDAEHAFKIARTFDTEKSPNTIVDIFRVIDDFIHEDYSAARETLNSIPADGTAKFIGPFVNAWLSAARGEIHLQGLQGNTVQLYHGILISDFLNDHSEVEKIIDRALNVEDIRPDEVERIADLYGHVGAQKKALDLYSQVLRQVPDNEGIKAKIETLKSGKATPLFHEIKTPRDGMAQAFHDIANILHHESNDESARVFAHIALHLDPDRTDTLFLLGDINADHKQYDKAISYYDSIGDKDENYLKAQHKIIDIYDDTGQSEKALALLETLSKSKGSVETIIKQGDFYRKQEDFARALKAYDMAAKALGEPIPADYWHLHYLRGIAYEQSDNWPKAEKELKAALAFQPDHPYVLNYLGYAWADQGVNLDEAQAMIQKAVDLRPSDGYITDSLGWVLYRMQNYKGAVKWLEKAVELMPYDPTVNDHLGDAYWKVGRRLEARFQWERAKNYSQDLHQVETIKKKLGTGLVTEH